MDVFNEFFNIWLEFLRLLNKYKERLGKEASLQVLIRHFIYVHFTLKSVKTFIYKTFNVNCKFLKFFKKIYA